MMSRSVKERRNEPGGGRERSGWERAVSGAQRLVILLALALPVLPVWAGSAEPLVQSGSEYDVKAAYLYNFITFTEWPADALAGDNPIVIGIVGDDPFRGALDRIAGSKTVGGRRLVIRRIASGQDCRGCQVLFITASEKRNVHKILDSVRGSGTLTVADMDGFIKSGGVINFFIEERRLRFEVNPNAAAQARLKLSSQLLRSAKVSNG